MGKGFVLALVGFFFCLYGIFLLTCSFGLCLGDYAYRWSIEWIGLSLLLCVIGIVAFALIPKAFGKKITPKQMAWKLFFGIGITFVIVLIVGDIMGNTATTGVILAIILFAIWLYKNHLNSNKIKGD